MTELRDDLPDWLDPLACAVRYRARAEEVARRFTDQNLPVPPRIQRSVAIFLDAAAYYESIAKQRQDHAQEEAEQPHQPHEQVAQAPAEDRPQARATGGELRDDPGDDDDPLADFNIDDIDDGGALVMALDMPVGTRVRYWPIRRENGAFAGEPLVTTTRSVPYAAASGDMVVFLEGKAGFVHLDHVEKLPEELPKPERRVAAAPGAVAFIIKVRERSEYTTQTVKGPRRVKAWGSWVGHRYGLAAGDVERELAEFKPVPGLREVGVFHKGKRVSLAQVRAAATGDPVTRRLEEIRTGLPSEGG